jgi:hypothetical protein
VLVCYSKIVDVSKINTIEIYNSVLIDWSSEQQILHVTAFGTKKVFFFTDSSKRCVKILTNHRCFSKIIIFYTETTIVLFMKKITFLLFFLRFFSQEKKQPKSLLNNRKSTTPTSLMPNVRPSNA